MTHDPSQQENLERVADRISYLVLEFCAETVTHNFSVFFMEELRNYVFDRVGGAIAPDSPGRILRMLRRAQQIDYIVLSRCESLYELTKVNRV